MAEYFMHEDGTIEFIKKESNVTFLKKNPPTNEKDKIAVNKQPPKGTSSFQDNQYTKDDGNPVLVFFIIGFVIFFIWLICKVSSY